MRTVSIETIQEEINERYDRIENCEKHMEKYKGTVRESYFHSLICKHESIINVLEGILAKAK